MRDTPGELSGASLEVVQCRLDGLVVVVAVVVILLSLVEVHVGSV